MPEVLGAVATCFSGLFFLVNAWQVKPFWDQGSVGEASAMPFLATHVNAILWLKYGLIKVDWPVAMVNGMGMITSTIALLFYHRFALDRGSFEQQLLQILLGITILLLGHYWGYWSDAIIALAAILSTLVMFMTPLQAMPAALRGHGHPFSLAMSLTTLCLCCLWAIYGWRKQDPVIMGPQLVGILMASAQLAIILLKYPAKPSHVTIPGNSILPIARKAKDSQEPL